MNNTNKLVLQRLEEVFFKKLEEKTGWGRNLVKQRFKDSVKEVVLEMIDEICEKNSTPTSTHFHLDSIKPGPYGFKIGDFNHDSCHGSYGPPGDYAVDATRTDSLKFHSDDPNATNYKSE